MIEKSTGAFVVISDNAKLIAALGLYWAWSAVSFFGTIMFPSSQSQYQDSELLHFVSLAVCALLTLSLVLARRAPHNGSQNRIAVIGCASATLGSTLTIVSPYQSVTLLVVAAVITGVGEAIMLYRLCLFVNPGLGVRNTLVTFSTALLISTAVYAMLHTIGGIAASAINALLPLVILGIVLKGLPSGSPSTDSTVRQHADKAPFGKESASNAHKAPEFPWQLILGFSVFGIAFGLIRGVPSPDTSDISLYYLVHQLGRAGTGLIVIFIARKAKDEYWAVTAFGLACFVVAFLATYQAESSAMQFAVNIASTLGYTCFELLMWAIIFDIVSETNARFNMTYGLGRGCMQIGIAFGTTLILFADRSLPDGFFAPAFQTSVVAMMLVMLGCFSTRSISELWGMKKKSLGFPVDTDAVLQDALSERFGLSPRECDVATLLAKGRSEPFIAESLFVSRSTVHSHITRIYSKTDVHSRQEFLSLAENLVQASTMDTTRADQKQPPSQL